MVLIPFNCLFAISRAKLLLKKKRFQETVLEKSDKQLDNIDEMCHSLEFAQLEVKVKCELYCVTQFVILQKM